MNWPLVVLYDFGLDGGAVGTHLLRGGSVHDGDLFMAYGLLVTGDIADGGSGAILSVGWAARPDAFFRPGVPAVGDAAGLLNYGDVIVSRAQYHRGPSEPVILTISGGNLTAGSFELAISRIRL